jgi:hypothetical protein
MAALTERHEIAWAILVLALLVATILWRRTRRVRRAPERHLRIDLVAGEGEDGDRRR